MKGKAFSLPKDVSFRERDPVNQILREPERTEPAADKAAEQAAEHKEKPERGKGHCKSALI